MLVEVVHPFVAVGTGSKRVKVENFFYRRELPELVCVCGEQPVMRSIRRQRLPRDLSFVEECELLFLAPELWNARVPKALCRALLAHRHGDTHSHLNAKDVVRGAAQLGIFADVPVLVDMVDAGGLVAELGSTLAKPSVKQHLAAIKMLFDWLVIGQVISMNPASSVRGPRHSVKKGKTSVLSAEEMRRLVIPIGLPRVRTGAACGAPNLAYSAWLRLR